MSRPPSTTSTPFTATKGMPSLYWLGCSKVARLPTVAGSKQTRSAQKPSLSRPRSLRPAAWAGNEVILRMASSSRSTPCSRT